VQEYNRQTEVIGRIRKGKSCKWASLELTRNDVKKIFFKLAKYSFLTATY